MGASPTTQIESNGCDATAASAFIIIPNISQDDITKLPVCTLGAASDLTLAFQSQLCGSNFGIEGMKTIAMPLVSKFYLIR